LIALHTHVNELKKCRPSDNVLCGRPPRAAQP